MFTKEMAHQFALMLEAGLPVDHVMIYFLPEASEGERKSVAAGWVRSKALQEAVRDLQGADWQELPLEQRIKRAIDKHYSELAYFLYTHNYTEVAGLDKTKADTARSVLETKLAGLAGQGDPLTMFWNDLKNGKVSLGKTPTLATLPS